MKILVSLIIGFLFSSVFFSYHIGEINLLLRTLGYVAFAFLSLSLLVSPIVSLTGYTHIVPYRKILGVLAFFVALGHSGKYFFDEYTYNGVFFIAKHFLELDVLSGSIALGLISILGVTSLRFFTRLLGTHWKSLQTLVFPLFCIASAHIAFASRFDIGYMIMIGAVILVRTVDAMMKSDAGSESSHKGRWLCVPCGYIYDPLIGDIDSGIAPGTAFEDIPDDWTCPLCGVKKSDFVPLGDPKKNEESQDAQVTSYNLLNPTTLELSVELRKPIKSLPGQYMKFIFQDKDGEFSRCYSIVEQRDNTYTFTIKLKGGRSGVVLERLKVGDTIQVAGIYGNFLLENTTNPKVFIASGTGLAPIVHMMASLDPEVAKTLYFSVSHKNELFYEDRLRQIPNLTLHIHITQEDIVGYASGRISVENMGLPPDTEYYLCGAPGLVASFTDTLKAQGYTRIFSEKF